MAYRREDRDVIPEWTVEVESGRKVYLDPSFDVQRAGLSVGLVPDPSRPPYWERYQRFLRNNRIPHAVYDISAPTWIEDAAAFNCVVWRPRPQPWQLEEAREKIWFLERHLSMAVHPSFDEMMFYENKVYQYYRMKKEGLPIIDTAVFVDPPRDISTRSPFSTATRLSIWRIVMPSFTKRMMASPLS